MQISLKYSFIQIAVALCFFAAAIGANVFIDPYYYFGSPRIVGINVAKPASSQQSMLAKKKLMRRMEPRTVIIGDSRASVGLQSASEVWPTALQPVFNFGVAGQDLEGVLEIVDRVSQSPGVSTVVWGVDGLEFLFDPQISKPLELHDQDESSAFDAFANGVTEFVRVAGSLKALSDSVETVLGQYAARPGGFGSDGSGDGGEFPLIVQREGHAALFAQKDSQFIDFVVNRQLVFQPDPSRPTDRMIAFESGLRQLASHDVDVFLFIYPYHARLNEVFNRAGLAPELDAWRDWLEATVTNVAQRYPDATIRLWDFNFYTDYSMEPVPPPGDSQAMQWYWESIHFNRALGDIILATVLRPSASTDGCSSLGERLYPPAGGAPCRGLSGREHYPTIDPYSADRISRLMANALAHPDH